MSENPNLQVDDNWKSQAQREKENLAGIPPETPAAPPAEPGKQRQLPPASLAIILDMFAMQAMVSLGAVPDPSTGKPQKDLDLARHFIDLIGVLAEKCKGNATEDEQKMLDATLYQLRMNFVQAAKK